MSRSDINTIKKLVTRREFLVGGGAVFLAAAMIACSQKVTTSEQQTVTTSSPSSTASTPKYGNTLRYIKDTIPANIGWPADTQVPLVIVGSCFDTLLRADNKGNIYPGLAETYKLAGDRSSITFNLRKDVKFHDGSEFNADVAKWNLDNYIDAGLQKFWKSVEVVDNNTVRINFKEWQNTTFSSVVEPTYPPFMISKAAFDKNGKDYMMSHPIGTGPFSFDGFTLDVSLKFKKNPNYWIKGKPYLDGIDFSLIADISTRKMAMKAGQGDILEMQSGKDILEFKNAGFNVQMAASTSLFTLLPDSANANSPWSNIKVREAAEYAIDKEALAEVFGYGFAKAPYQIVPPASSLAYNQDFNLGRKYDAAKAKQLLTEAGFADGFDTTLTAIPMANRDSVAAIQSYLAAVGIRAKLDFPEMGRWVSNYMGPNANWNNAVVYCLVFNISGLDFVTGLQQIFNTDGQAWLKSPELMDAYQAFLISPDVDIAKVRKVTDMMIRDALFIPVEQNAGGWALAPKVFAQIGNRNNELLTSPEDFWINKP